MGTNYYLRKKCSHCNNAVYEEHIGKSAAGWQFLFNGSHIKNSLEWYAALRDSDDEIFDEYGRKIEVDQFIEFIESCKDKWQREPYDQGPYHFSQSNSREWYEPNFRFYDGDFL